MAAKASGEGIKIAQAAKDLNVTSVTIRRYITEFNIETESDENGVKVLPVSAMDELLEIRRLKEEGLTNPQVTDHLEELRSKSKSDKPKPKRATKAKSVDVEVSVEQEEDSAETEDSKPAKARKARVSRKAQAGKEESPESSDETEESSDLASSGESVSGESIELEEISDSGRSKHVLTCQTCGKSFEHMNPRLRDCLDCYRSKRKERRRGGADKQKTVIQNPVAQKMLAKAQQSGQAVVTEVAAQVVSPSSVVVQRSAPVRSYRKAIEETRYITNNLKRRLERSDLPEGDRRWLEQVYAYQLILHQGWRHLAEYRSGTNQQHKAEKAGQEA